MPEKKLCCGIDAVFCLWSRWRAACGFVSQLVVVVMFLRTAVSFIF